MLRLSCVCFFILGATCLWGGSDGAARKQAQFEEFLQAPEQNHAAVPRKKAKDIKPGNVIHWTLVSQEVDGEGRLRISLRLQTDQGFTLYKDKLEFEFSLGLAVAGRKDPPSVRRVDPVTGSEVEVYPGGDFEFILMDPEHTGTVELTIKYIGCTSQICLFPYTETIRIYYNVKTAPHTKPAATPKSKTQVGEGAPWDERLAAMLRHSSDLSLVMILLISFLGGLLTNLTPCVYPMIPITVRILARQTYSPRLSAVLYGMGIMGTYTGLGLLAASTGKLFGGVAASAGFNLVVGLCMFLLGLSMIGIGSLSGLQKYGETISTGAKGAKASFLMGAGAGLIAAPCTGPILAALLTYTIASKSLLEATLLFLVYSFGFSLPYMLLGSFAGHIQKRMFSGNAQSSVKILFSAIMFALGFYYLRISLYSVHQALESYWGMIGLSAFGISAICLLALPRVFPSQVCSVLGSLTLGLALFAGSQWPTYRPAPNQAGIHWLHSEDEAFAVAQVTGAPILIDMWAEWCEACKKMDQTTFRDVDIIQILKDKNWVLLKLDLTEESPSSDRIQERYHVQGLPTLVIIPPHKGIEDQLNLTGFVSAERLKQELTTYSK